MARANQNKCEDLVTSTTTASNYIPKRTRTCINWNPPLSDPNLLSKSNIVKQDLLHKYISWKFYEVRSERGISIDADSGPPRYVIWCCGGICHQPDTIIHIGSGHTVVQFWLPFYLLKDSEPVKCIWWDNEKRISSLQIFQPMRCFDEKLSNM